MPRAVTEYGTDELLYALLLATRRQQWAADPLRFGVEVCPQHFSKPPAALHRRIVALVTGQEVGESGGTPTSSLPLSVPPSDAHTVACSVPS